MTYGTRLFECFIVLERLGHPDKMIDMGRMPYILHSFSLLFANYFHSWEFK